MNNMFKSLILLLLLGAIFGADECPCTLVDSVKYPGTLKWDCQNLGLTSVPGQCYEEQAENVTELIMTGNSINQVLSIDLVGLVDLRALYFDLNIVDYFDPSALIGISKLEIFNGAHNLDMDIPEVTLRDKKELKEVIFTGSRITLLPNITAATKLEWLDIRSCELLKLSRPTFGTLETTGDNFVLSMVGNPAVVDIAADIFLPIPDLATINMDTTATIWAKDEAESLAVRNKEWKINVDLNTNLKVCGVDGNPIDSTMCA